MNDMAELGPATLDPVDYLAAFLSLLAKKGSMSKAPISPPRIVLRSETPSVRIFLSREMCLPRERLGSFVLAFMELASVM